MNFPFGPEVLVAALMFGAALLYSSVGHAGASAYLAIMALFSMPAMIMRPTALALNILVASLVAHRFWKAGHFRWRTLWPFLLGSVPMAFAGGYIQPPTTLYRPLVGAMLLLAAARLLWPGKLKLKQTIVDPPIWAGILCGAAIGLLSGLTGTGGGIFLSPVLLLFGWASLRGASATAAVFILANSTFGLMGNLASVNSLPPQIMLFAAAVLAGAMLGSRLGIVGLSNQAVLRALGVVLLIAGGKLLAF